MRDHSAAIRRSRQQANLYEALERMESTIEQETELLRENRAVELTDFNHRKHQGLLEINRILRAFDRPDFDGTDRSRIDRLVGKLEQNQRILAHHLKAVDEIAGLVARAMQEAESDGTYGRGGA
jgi:hypothetical protein